MYNPGIVRIRFLLMIIVIISVFFIIKYGGIIMTLTQKGRNFFKSSNEPKEKINLGFAKVAAMLTKKVAQGANAIVESPYTLVGAAVTTTGAIRKEFQEIKSEINKLDNPLHGPNNSGD